MTKPARFQTDSSFVQGKTWASFVWGKTALCCRLAAKTTAVEGMRLRINQCVVERCSNAACGSLIVTSAPTRCNSPYERRVALVATVQSNELRLLLKRNLGDIVRSRAPQRRALSTAAGSLV